MSLESLPFLTITSCLTANRCWLCEQTFPRGLTKKAFQVHNVLDYFQNRYKQEKDAAAIDAPAESAAPSDELALSNELPVPTPCPPIRTKNFADCYNYYKKEMDEHGTIDNLLHEFKENDLELWMSGLICALHGGCASDAALFIQSSKKITSSSKKKPAIPLGITFANKDCPPNCGCDNPWGFLSS